MNHDIDIKKLRLNCFRQSKVPGEFMLQMRVPGGMVDAKYLSPHQLLHCIHQVLYFSRHLNMILELSSFQIDFHYQ